MSELTPERAARPPSTFRRRLLEVTIGTLLGLLAACLSGPSTVSWWYSPPSQDAFSCAGSVRDALSFFVRLQLGCAVAGGLVLLGISFLLRRSKSKRQAAAA